VGEALLIEYRYADGDDDRLGALARELVVAPVEIIVATDGQAIQAAKDATSTIPIVMISSGDPVGVGFVQSLERPGGNITGLTSLSTELAPKRLQYLRDIYPALTRVGVLANPENSVRKLEWERTRQAAESLGLRAQPLFVSETSEIEPAVRNAVADGVDGLMVFGDTVLVNARDKIFALTAEYRIPVMYEGSRRVLDGGLISYSPALEERYRRSAIYVDKILRGASPADLPVEEPRAFELTVNLSTAESLGLTIPDSITSSADRVVR